MSQIKVKDGDLYIIFLQAKDDVLITYQLDNGAEFDFNNDGELVQLILPNFEMQLNRGSLVDVPIELVDSTFDNTKLSLAIKIFNDTINIHLDCSSIIHKV